MNSKNTVLIPPAPRGSARGRARSRLCRSSVQTQLSPLPGCAAASSNANTASGTVGVPSFSTLKTVDPGKFFYDTKSTTCAMPVNAAKIEKQPVGLSPVSEQKSLVNVATSPISCTFLEKVDYPSDTDFGIVKKGIENITVTKKPRIKYDRDTLLQFCDEASMPPRFIDILTFPKFLIEDKPKCVDPLQMQQVHWVVVDENAGGLNHRVNGYNNNNGSRAPFSKGQWNQNGWNRNNIPRFNKIEQTPSSDSNDAEW